MEVLSSTDSTTSTDYPSFSILVAFLEESSVFGGFWIHGFTDIEEEAYEATIKKESRKKRMNCEQKFMELLLLLKLKVETKLKRIRNKDSKLVFTLKQFDTKHCTLLTGTPLQVCINATPYHKLCVILYKENLPSSKGCWRWRVNKALQHRPQSPNLQTTSIPLIDQITWIG
ncbi:unnamed protein product [Lactuca saligna]|uniref:Uncharacterized protein n=1 Tax=Lactuca saligna TaxID=75948 RepID=A0AA35UJX7_LACSI|nr:unnamed protein product [Lactuca saligna]